MASNDVNESDQLNQPLIILQEITASPLPQSDLQGGDESGREKLTRRLWIESKKLWHIAGPAIFTRIATFSMNIVTVAFAGHIGDLDLAALSIANNVIIGFNFGLLAFGAKQLHMLSIYMQRSWMVLFLCSLVLLPCYVFATPVLKLIGEPDDVAELSGKVAVWLIPLHFSFAFNFPLQRFLQSQLKPGIMAWASLAVFLIHIFLSWFLVYVIRLGIAGLVIALDVAYWLQPLFQLAYVLFGGCPDTWNGFSWEAFSGLWDFVKLSAASGVMLCLENWYYRILVIMTGDLKNAAIAVDALSVCMTINGWEMMIPLAFFAATGVRVSNELGAGNGKAAKFATKIAVATSTVIGLFFCAIIMIFHNKFALIFTSSDAVLEAVNSLAWLLAVAILLNSIQPVLSGVAVGSGWQAWVAYINLGCYYIVGLPLGIIMGWVFHTGVQGIWAGMIFGGTGLQTLVLSMVVARCDWDKEAEKATKHVQRWAN